MTTCGICENKKKDGFRTLARCPRDSQVANGEGDVPWKQVVPVVDHTVRKLCTRPYPGHPRGCPNFDRQDRCPGRAPLVERVLNLHREVWAIWNEFDLASHVERMRQVHATWSERQLCCCLYWQGTARKQLRATVERFQRVHGPLDVLETPEAAGVNVTATMFQADIVLEWPPQTMAFQVVLAGLPSCWSLGTTRVTGGGL